MYGDLSLWLVLIFTTNLHCRRRYFSSVTWFESRCDDATTIFRKRWSGRKPAKLRDEASQVQILFVNRVKLLWQLPQKIVVRKYLYIRSSSSKGIRTAGWADERSGILLKRWLNFCQLNLHVFSNNKILGRDIVLFRINLIILEFLLLDFNTRKLWFHCINFLNLALVNKYFYLCRCINIIVQFLLIPDEFNFLAFPYVKLLEFSKVGIVKIEMK